MTSIHCMLRFSHSPLNISKNNYRVCGEMDTVDVYIVGPLAATIPNYTYSSTVAFTAQHERHFIIKFMIF